MTGALEMRAAVGCVADVGTGVCVGGCVTEDLEMRAAVGCVADEGTGVCITI